MESKNNKARILFRADGSNEIGLGHVYRCLAIAERLSGDFDSFFAIRQPSIELRNVISKFANLIVLNEYKNYNDDAKDLSVNIVSNYRIDIITLDGYYFNTDYQKVIKEKCKSVLISIDDDQPFHYVSDVVINHAGGVDEAQISKESYTRLFLGYDYLLLRKEFIKLLNAERKVDGIHSVLICFGGADPDNFTGKMLDCLKNEPNIHKIIIIIGASYTQTEKLKCSIAEHTHVEIRSNLDAGTLSGLMSSTDLAIVPSSTIGLEAFASKMILITGRTAENQNAIYNGLIKENSVIGIDNFNGLTCQNLLKNLNKAAKKHSNYTFISKNKVHDAVFELYKSLI